MFGDMFWFLWLCVCVCVCVCVYTQSCLTFCDPMNCSLTGSSVHGILQARILEWVAISFSRGSSPPKNRTLVSYVSCIGRRILHPLSHLGEGHSLLGEGCHSEQRPGLLLNTSVHSPHSKELSGPISTLSGLRKHSQEQILQRGPSSQPLWET